MVYSICWFLWYSCYACVHVWPIKETMIFLYQLSIDIIHQVLYRRAWSNSDTGNHCTVLLSLHLSVFFESCCTQFYFFKSTCSNQLMTKTILMHFNLSCMTKNLLVFKVDVKWFFPLSLSLYNWSACPIWDVKFFFFVDFYFLSAFY